jgi:hypothetical protein
MVNECEYYEYNTLMFEIISPPHLKVGLVVIEKV